MLRHPSLAFLGLTLAACATGTQYGNTRLVFERVNHVYSQQEQCQPTRTASLSQDQVTGLDELPVELRDQVLAEFPVQAVGRTEWTQCQDVATRILEERLRRLCWVEARVTPQGDAGTGAPDALPRLSVQLGAPYQVGHIFVSTGEGSTLSPARVIKAARSAIPKDNVCTASMLEDIRARVAELGTFHEVHVAHGPLDNETKKVPLVVNVQEKAPAPQPHGG
jgi:hypothetical protein